MTALKIFCWCFLIFIGMGRVANYNNSEHGTGKVRLIDYLMMIALISFLYLISK